jgi:hypothetical protein
MAAETSPEDATAAVSSTTAEGIAPAPDAASPIEETVPEKGGVGKSLPRSTTESETSEMKDAETETAATAESMNGEEKPEDTPDNSKAIVSSTKRSRPAYKFDPDKITLRFLFANRDGLTVTLECEPSDTVAEVKAALLSVWPDGKYSAVLYQIPL